jgi:hypothetical protein
MLFLLFISIWLAAIINVVLNTYVNNFLISSSVSLFSGYTGLLFWLIVGASAATSFILGLDKLGILQMIWQRFSIKDSNKDEGYEPEIYVATEKPQSISSTVSSVVKQKVLVKQEVEPAPVHNKEIIMTIEKDRQKTKDNMKAYFLFGETQFKNCQHEFGYLKKKLKNKPIPDECFGCPKLLDCFETKSRKKKHELSTIL